MKPKTKLIISLLWDFTDFFGGRIPVSGTVFDLLGTGLAIYLYGGKGALAGLELLDVTDQIDAFLPSLTLLWLLSEGKL